MFFCAETKFVFFIFGAIYRFKIKTFYQRFSHTKVSTKKELLEFLKYHVKEQRSFTKIFFKIEVGKICARV